MDRSNGITPMTRGRINLRTQGRVPDIRLPKNTIPSHYDLTINAIWEPEFYIDGSFSVDSRVTLNFVEDGYFTINLRYINIHEDTLTLTSNGEDLAIRETIYDVERESLTIKYVLPVSTILDDEFDLTVSADYTGKILPGLVSNMSL